MDLIEKSFDLLTQQTAFVAVRIYGTSEFDGQGSLWLIRGSMAGKTIEAIGPGSIANA